MMTDVDMNKMDLEQGGSATAKTPLGQDRVPRSQTELTVEDESKDVFFIQIAEMAEAMIAQHGRDFAIGTLVLAAKFIAEGRPLTTREAENGGPVSTINSG
jgi:hypothetical protein